jgi:hypothetical protein
MPATSLEEILKFYEDFEDYQDESEWMVKLVKHLVANRDLSSFYPFTSHETLCFSMFESHEDWFEKPIISIDINWEASEEYKYKISFERRKVEADLWRQFLESVYCPFEKCLEIFDEMAEKLKEASK